MLLGFLVLIWMFGGCVHKVGYPWNCAEARNAVREAQSDYNANYSRQMSKKYADEEMINTTVLKQFALSKAENKLNELCAN